MKKIVYHATDLDGHCSGALAKHFDPDAELMPLDYGEEFDFSNLTKDDEVIMVDFSLQPYEKMEELNDVVKLTWIDHHKSAIEALSWDNVNGLRDTSKAACELVWEYYKGGTPPEFVTLLGRYDIWDKENPDWKEKILPFEFGLKMIETDPVENYDIWTHLLTGHEAGDLKFISDTTNNGKLVLKYKEQADKEIMDSLSYEAEFEGYKAIVCNAMGNSNTFDSKWNPNKYDIMIMYKHVKGEFFTVSFYTTRSDIDTSKIAVKYGGGGHPQASGCQVDMIELIDNNLKLIKE